MPFAKVIVNNAKKKKYITCIRNHFVPMKQLRSHFISNKFTYRGGVKVKKYR